MNQLPPMVARRAFLTVLMTAAPSAAWAQSADRLTFDFHPIRTTRPYEVGVASFYRLQARGQRTASGETLSGRDYTAAHRDLPFGTLLHVTNLDNGRSVLVKVNDRGPAVDDRIIDLSERAAYDLDMISAGVARVSLNLIDRGISLRDRSD
jgi:rare lipoprotein A